MMYRSLALVALPAIMAIPMKDASDTLVPRDHIMAHKEILKPLEVWGTQTTDNSLVRKTEVMLKNVKKDSSAPIFSTETIVFDENNTVDVTIYVPPVPMPDVQTCSNETFAKMDILWSGAGCKEIIDNAIALPSWGIINMTEACTCIDLVGALDDGLPNCTPESGIELTYAQMGLACQEKIVGIQNTMKVETLNNSHVEPEVTTDDILNVSLMTTAKITKRVNMTHAMLLYAQDKPDAIVKACEDPVLEMDNFMAEVHALHAKESDETDYDLDKGLVIQGTKGAHIKGFKGIVAPLYDPNEDFDAEAHAKHVQEKGLMPEWYTDLVKKETYVSTLAVNWRARRNGKTLKQRFKDRFRKEIGHQAKKQAKTYAYEAVAYSKQALYNAYKSRIPDGPTSTWCTKTYGEFTKMEGHFEYFVTNPMEQIDDKGNKVIEYSDLLIQTQSDLDRYNLAMLALSTVLQVLSFLPYVGTAMNYLNIAIKNSRKVVKKTHDALKKFNDKITHKLKPKVETLVEKNSELAEKIEHAEWALTEYGIEPALLIDNRCSSATYHTICSSSVTNGMVWANGQLQTARNQIDHIKNLLMTPYYEMKKIYDAIYTHAYNVFKSIMDTISGLLKPFTDLLKVRICFPLPQVRWQRECAHVPCGLSCGWGGCSVKWCHVCVDVPVPYFKNFCFSVRDVLEGIANVIGIVMDGLMNIIKKMIPGMPSINIPGLPNVNFPNIGLPNFPSLPAINWPALGFPCLNFGGYAHVQWHGWSNTGIMAGVPALQCSGGVNSNGCFSFPQVNLGPCQMRCP